MVQVAGRAGRGEVKGSVYLQTRDPDHPAIVSARDHDVAGFARRELLARRELGYPPYSRLAMLRVDGPTEKETCDFAEHLAKAAGALDVVRAGEVAILGPAPSPIARLRGKFRFQVLLKARERKALRRVLSMLFSARHEAPRALRVVIDVDPVSML
jgi:primosomal protein N' (replication factor Y) (superfamily II helicase)